MKKNILILGGTGFLGTNLVLSLLADKDNCIFIYHRGKTKVRTFEAVTYICGERSEEGLKRLKDISWHTIYDLGGFFPSEVLNSIKVFQNNVDNYIYCSSASVYDIKNRADLCPIAEEDNISASNNIDLYSRFKILCERLLLNAFCSNSFPVTIIRPTIMIGQYDTSNRIFYWLKRLLGSQPFIVPQDHQNYYLNLVDVRDVAKILVLLSQRPNVKGAIFNISATEHQFSLHQFVATLASHVHKSCQFHNVPSSLLISRNIFSWQEYPFMVSIQLYY
ncbi:NAD-dependent epimerase/dehydratase family protein [Candidatus Margulisiibacteriota bacterium]